MVRKLTLYLKPDTDADSVAFSSFTVSDRFIPGKDELDTDQRGRWRLTLENAPMGDSGTVKDSIGRAMGLRWTIPSTAVKRVTGRKIGFTVYFHCPIGTPDSVQLVPVIVVLQPSPINC